MQHAVSYNAMQYNVMICIFGPKNGNFWQLCSIKNADFRAKIYCMELNCILWYCIVSYGNALVLHGISLYCMVLQDVALYGTVLHCIVLNLMVLHGIALYHC